MALKFTKFCLILHKTKQGWLQVKKTNLSRKLLSKILAFNWSQVQILGISGYQYLPLPFWKPYFEAGL